MSEKTSEALLAELEAQERAISEPGGRARVERHHKLGRLLGRERVTRFLDDRFDRIDRRDVTEPVGSRRFIPKLRHQFVQAQIGNVSEMRGGAATLAARDFFALDQRDLGAFLG